MGVPMHGMQAQPLGSVQAQLPRALEPPPGRVQAPGQQPRPLERWRLVGQPPLDERHLYRCDTPPHPQQPYPPLLP